MATVAVDSPRMASAVAARTEAEEKLRLFLDKFDAEVDARIQALKDNCESSISTLRVHLEMEISKLTKPILELTMGQFIGEFHGDPLEYFKRTMAMQVDAASGAARRPVRRLVAHRPAGNSNTINDTPSRHIARDLDLLGPTPRRSERAKKNATIAMTPVSTRRWPGDDGSSTTMDRNLMTPGTTDGFRTVVLVTPMRHAVDHSIPETPSRFLAVPLRNGSLVEVNPFSSPSSALEGVTQEGRDEIKEQLLAMQAQLNAFLDKLK